MTISTDHGYSINYSGGRLADVMINGVAVAAVQVRAYDFETGKFGAEPSEEQIRAKVAAAIDPEDMEDYRLIAGEVSVYT